MLIRLPRGPSGQPGAKKSADGCSPFEAALRRDLASAPVVSYEPVLGGWAKRAIDLALTLLALPLWLPLLLGVALYSKLRLTARVFQARQSVGYGGRVFRYLRLRVTPAAIDQLHTAGGEPAPANDWQAIASGAEDSGAKWRRALERLPQLLNVLVGDMALVGPRPLSPEQLEALKTGKRYYLSMRPGVVSVSAIADAHEEQASLYKIYARAWSLSVDVLILWDALRSLRDRGELWKPSPRLPRIVARNAVRRRRTGSVA